MKRYAQLTVSELRCLIIGAQAKYGDAAMPEFLRGQDAVAVTNNLEHDALIGLAQETFRLERVIGARALIEVLNRRGEGAMVNIHLLPSPDQTDEEGRILRFIADTIQQTMQAIQEGEPK